jgi:hypothetical protein
LDDPGEKGFGDCASLEIDPMGIVYVEARPRGLQEGSAVDDYVVEDAASYPLGTFKTLRDAIAWAKLKGHVVRVPRVRRHLNDKTMPEQWRKVT